MKKTGKKVQLILLAAVMALLLFGCKKSQQKIYEEAHELLANGRYDEAAQEFDKVTTISDARKFSLYAKALKAAEEGNYEDARITLEGLGDFSDAPSMLKYMQAQQTAEGGNITDLLEAKEIYASIPLFRDSNEQILNIDNTVKQLIGLNPVGTVEVGDLVKFGEYNSKKIVWRTLSVKDGKALLVAEKAVASRPFHEEESDNDDPKVWEECSLREWLNGAFLQEAFSEEERALIMRTARCNNMFEEWETFDPEEQKIISKELTDLFDGVKYPKEVQIQFEEEVGEDLFGPDTEDTVFLLSANEAVLYFENADDRILTVPIKKEEPEVEGLEEELEEEESEDAVEERSITWSLQSIGFCVLEDGSLGIKNQGSYAGIRPAIYVPVLSGEEKQKARETRLENDYNKACDLAEKDTIQELKEAQELFEDNITYKDSESKLQTVKEKIKDAKLRSVYDKACALAEKHTVEELEEAVELFEKIIDYKDSRVRIWLAEEKITRIETMADYDEACALAEKDTVEELEKAQRLFQSISPYEDSESKLKMVEDKLRQARLRPIVNASVGEIVEFGRYYQEADQGGEPIEWIVLAVEGDRTLLISRYGLETMPYHDTEENVSWEECSLRHWLNDAFLQEAFTDDEKVLISDTMNITRPYSKQEEDNGDEMEWDYDEEDAWDYDEEDAWDYDEEEDWDYDEEEDWNSDEEDAWDYEDEDAWEYEDDWEENEEDWGYDEEDYDEYDTEYYEEYETESIEKYETEYEGDGEEQTWDRIFLLSMEEVEAYFKEQDDRRTVPTSYAIENGAWTDPYGYCYWWLRYCGHSRYTAAVTESGLMDDNEATTIDNDCVRPALWINTSGAEELETEDESYDIYERVTE